MGIYIGLDNNRSGGLAIGGGRRRKQQPMTEYESAFTFDSVPAGVVDGKGKLKMVKGRSLVFNQLATTFQNADAQPSGSFTYSGNGFTAASWSAYTAFQFIILATRHGHKCFYKIYSSCAGGGINLEIAGSGIALSNGISSGIVTVPSNSRDDISLYSDANVTDVVVKDFYFIDLTLMFGAGNEPATVAEFEKLFPLPYYDYNAGNIKNNMTTAVKFTGFNQWDEEWESGTLNPSTGEPISGSHYVRSKNGTRVIPNEEYCLRWGTTYSAARNYGVFILGYDANNSFVSAFYASSVRNTEVKTFTVPSGCAFVKFSVGDWEDVATPTYKNDICINISDANRNGEYEPHKETIVQLDLTTKTGKLNGEGSSVTIAPDGLKSAGNIFDECIVEGGYTKEVLRLAKQSITGPMVTIGGVYNNIIYYQVAKNNNAAAYNKAATSGYKHSSFVPSSATGDWDNASKIGCVCGGASYTHWWFGFAPGTTLEQAQAALAGTELIYELATPLEYTLDNPIPVPFQSYAGGTMMQLPQNGSAPTTAPMVMLADWPVQSN